MAVGNLTAQTTVSGIVYDGRETLAGANVFIIGTIDGCLTDSLGRFSFTTSMTGEVTLKATFIGFEDYTLTADAGRLHHLTVHMKEQATTINEVVVTASTFSFGKSENFKTMDALDVVMAGNSCGDIVAALQTLPGTQTVGESGKLYVRGGESNECQTFVNGMHVLMPYSTNTENTAVRGRFSPFLFKGINFSLGGYGGEYGQALSSVLPMETTDAATSDKFGVSASLVDWNVGGTKAYQNSSLSFNVALTSMGLYNRLFSERFDYTRPYRKLSGEIQYKKEYNASSVLKSYVGYDLTSVGQRIEDRMLSLKEHNVYANVTHKATIGNGYTLFTGMANSTVFSDIDDAKMAGDHYHNFRHEIHLKAELRKVCSDVLKLSAGVEDYIRNSTLDAIRAALPGVKIAHFNVDSPSFLEHTCNQLAERAVSCDGLFVTTAGDILRRWTTGRNFCAYMPNPSDPSMENRDNSAKTEFERDAFYACSPSSHAGRNEFVARLRSLLEGRIKCDWFGLGGRPTIWGAEYERVLATSKMGFNINRIEGDKWYSSDRIAHLMGFGELTFINSKGRFQDFFTPDEAVFYDSAEDLAEKAVYCNGHDGLRASIAAAGRAKYHRLFSGERVLRYMVETLYGVPYSEPYEWAEEVYR